MPTKYYLVVKIHKDSARRKAWKWQPVGVYNARKVAEQEAAMWARADEDYRYFVFAPVSEVAWRYDVVVRRLDNAESE